MTWHFLEVWALLLAAFAIGGVVGTLLYIGLAASPLSEAQLDVADAVHDNIAALGEFFGRWRTPAASYGFHRDPPAYVMPIPLPDARGADDGTYAGHDADSALTYADPDHPHAAPAAGPVEWVEEVAEALGVSDEGPLPEEPSPEAAWSADDPDWREGEADWVEEPWQEDAEEEFDDDDVEVAGIDEDAPYEVVAEDLSETLSETLAEEPVVPGPVLEPVLEPVEVEGEVEVEVEAAPPATVARDDVDAELPDTAEPVPEDVEPAAAEVADAEPEPVAEPEPAPIAEEVAAPVPVAELAPEPESAPAPDRLGEPVPEPVESAAASGPDPDPDPAPPPPPLPDLPPPVLPPMLQPTPARVRQPDLPSMRPLTLPGPRNGVPDNLQKIRGIGKKNEELLNGLGVYHFGQIAAWTPAEARWIANHMAFPERIERDDWIGQAIIFATGGDTGFVKTARRGDDDDEEPSVAA